MSNAATLVKCLWRGLGDPGSVLNQQLMLDNRLTGISQRFGENYVFDYYSAYSYKDLFEQPCLQR